VAAESRSTEGGAASGRAARSRDAPAGGIAVVGLAGQFPGGDGMDGYWRLLAQGRSAIGPVPVERWGRAHDGHAALLPDIASFDPEFFGIPVEDAAAMDPQALLVLEESLRLLCHAGYPAAEVKGRPIGVYLGGRSRHRPTGDERRRARHLVRAVGQNYLAANVSQFFDLRGPSVVLDTACSSALVAMSMAIPALLAGQLEAAVVGGVSLLTSDEAYDGFAERGLLSAAPAFHVFDRRAAGVVLGEGCGLVLLKTVEAALRDGDRIHAVIRALAINNSGRTAGPSAPDFRAQQDVMRAALAAGGQRPEEIGYVETNGSGSEVTDILELRAIEAVYRPDGGPPCVLGSVKPNIGHPLSAEGIASLLKVVLMARHRQRVPTLSGHESMEHYDLAASPFSFDRAPVAVPDGRAVAAVNCFADGGTNAHALVQAWDGAAGSRQPLPVPALHRRRLSDATMALAGEPATIWERYG
jgi:acyl transferase domain-containing protein